MPGPQRKSKPAAVRAKPVGFVQGTYDAVTSPENAAVTRSIAMFAVRRR
jgi:hypothetical protein